MDIESFQFHPTVEKIVNVLMEKAGNGSADFFRLQANFFLALIPSSLGVKIQDAAYNGRKPHYASAIPVNLYGLNLAPSGFGKGHSTNVLENELIREFKDEFTSRLFPETALSNMQIQAEVRELTSDKPAEQIFEDIKKQFNSSGTAHFCFDSATSPALKQLRTKFQIAELGSINIIIDEIGNNLTSNSDALTVLLELYDKGFTKAKLIKESKDAERVDDLSTPTPANLLMFGTDTALFDGANTEDSFMRFLETGYGRRLFFSYCPDKVNLHKDLTAEERYEKRIALETSSLLDELADTLRKKCDQSNIGLRITIPREVGIEIEEYKKFCDERAANLPKYDSIRKTELEHRYFKTLKLAGVYAFFDGNLNVTLENLHQAIKFTERSGEALDRILNRDDSYIRLAKFIASHQGKPLTNVDIMSKLPFYTSNKQRDLMKYAIAWGYRNNIIIKREFIDDIEFISGESLEETNMNRLIVSYGQDLADNYKNARTDMSQIMTLITAPGYNWCNHICSNGHRAEANMEPGFNLVVLDCDGDVPLETAQAVLCDYKYFIYSTKRATVDEPRFRIVLPTNYVLKLDQKDYKEFMLNLSNWLPFKSDEATFQRSRKWLSHPGEVLTNPNENAENLDVLPFIPRTAREANRDKDVKIPKDLTRLEQWFFKNIGEGNRNNMLYRYGKCLRDSGCDTEELRDFLLGFNLKLKNPLPEVEIINTILKSI